MNNLVTWLRANAWAWATVAWEWIYWAISAVIKSFIALIKSPAAWLACIIVFVVGFSIAHIARGDDVRGALDRVAELEHQKTETLRQLAASQAKVAALATALEKASQKPAEALPAVEAPPVPEKPKRKRAATPAPAKPVSAPVFKNPFGE